MNKQMTRAFATGLLAAAIALLIYLYFSPTQDLSVEKMKQKLEKDDYVVVNATTYHQQVNELARLQKEISAMNKVKPTIKQKETKKQTTSKQKTNSYHLVISSGTTSAEIGQKLEEAGIIHSREQFDEYLKDHHYATKIQIGEYDIQQSFTFEEIAKVITKQK
ncbi:cell division protein YceG involved in septum cleavage [Oikeobacillus pervagus]|uniref:Cell division protein YceG involved in septum cleavage n=1 Tax=Oikeobacillus pervagus TaxID=1325931 RepID=A0AAJ1SZ23_9BACI|nr:endolytic transglycosylase MltG [Oikeobacillus pervagus]MDQ0213877.1 cell division protein YceG involved in septum cleavage [Oikeobacillus pervagus]